MSTKPLSVPGAHAIANEAQRNALLYDLYWKAISIHAWRARIPDMEILEVKHELFIALTERILKFDPERGAGEKTFVEWVLKNKVVDMVRQAEARNRIDPLTPARVWS